ncbi:dolichol monophosphate mannose synthase [Vairimorpha necatrix]|uniref:Dolichol-phosphate mannosyltransferase subunit 1 n=1 Tax=Vairimorpha necatrix TaxID=6039 RepID=A0AAX4JGU0_9MICR
MYNVIIPTNNEQGNIACLLKMLQEVLDKLNVIYQIIIVDDGSTDDTIKEIHQSNTKFLKLVLRPTKLGLGSAYQAALEYCKYEYTIILDADLSHDPFYIQSMIRIQNITGCDLVSSSRYIKNGGVYNWSLYRKLVSRGANNLAKLVLNLRSSDLTGSFRLYKTEVLRILLGNCVSKGYSVQMEMMCQAEKRRFKIEECPIIFYEREVGVSKLGSKEILNFLLSILQLLKNKFEF